MSGYQDYAVIAERVEEAYLCGEKSNHSDIPQPDGVWE
jgi:hypothetical protein